MSHPHISLIVESRLSGPASGHLVVNTDQAATVDSLIGAFCTDKGIKHTGHYVLRTTNDLVLDNMRTLLASGLTDGDVVYLTNRTSSDEPFGFSNWLIMAGIALLIALIGLVAVCLVYSTTGSIADDHGIVFDAGSTHTTMMVYKWGGAKINDTGAPQQVHKCEVKGGGISMFVGREDQLADALRQCLEEGKSAVPGGKVSTTPLFLGATGGMRVLQIQDPKAVSKIMQAIDHTFAISGFQYQSGMAAIISGEAEGADAWVTSNYLTNQLIAGRSNGHSVGTLDLGGASTQYALQAEQNATLELLLYGVAHDVLTDSYLCFGRYQSLLRYLAQLTVGLTGPNATATDPCLPKGFSVSIPLKDIFASPCAWMDPSLNSTLDPSANVTFVGSSSPANCSLKVASLFNESECANHYKYPQCFTSKNLSALPMHYMAISGYYEVMSHLNLTDASATLQQLRDAVASLCKKPWTEVRHGVGAPAAVTQNYCYGGQYVDHILTTGYSFNNDTWSHLNFVDSLNNTDLGWTLGFMINATNSIAAELPAEPMNLPVFACLLVLFAVFVLLSLAFAAHAWKKKHQASAYQRLSQYGAI